jgi:hypothetical protein
MNTSLLLDTGQLTETGLRRTADGGLTASWALSWPEQQTAGVEPIMLQAYFGGSFRHPHLRGTTVHDWPLFLVNGADVEEGRNNGTSVIPTLDSIQEFRLLTSTFGLEYGRFSGAIVNVLTKSGTNEFHGSAFEFLRNSDLDSRNFFDRTRGTLKRNQFGGTVGGPILKNRLFFFTDYQGTGQSQGVTSPLLLAPSLIERGGDFSDTAITGFPATAPPAPSSSCKAVRVSPFTAVAARL